MGSERKLVLYLAMSMDGMIARKDGSIDWLPNVPGEDFGYSEFLGTVDTVIMGRATYDQVLSLGPFPYSGKRCFVFSTTREGSDGLVQYVNEGVGKFVDRLRSEEGSDIWLVGGSELADGFMSVGAVDLYVITMIPIVLGEGIALFRRGLPELKLRLKESRTFPYGLVQLRYVPIDGSMNGPP